MHMVLIKAQENSPEAFKIETPELPGALLPGPLPGHCPWTPPGALRPLDPTRDGSRATACSTWFSPAASTFLTGTFSKMTGNFKILAKALHGNPHLLLKSEVIYQGQRSSEVKL